MESGLQGPLPWPYKMLLYKQNKSEDVNTVFQNQEHSIIALSGQTWLCPKPGKSAVRLELPSSIPADRTPHQSFMRQREEPGNIPLGYGLALPRPALPSSDYQA